MASISSLILSIIIHLLLFMEARVKSFNLFISRDEMLRTLGIWAEMVYVANGEINDYSTQFPYRIAENVSHLVFTWNNQNKRVTLNYSVGSSSVNFNVLPILHIPTEGIVPRQSKSFVVEYRCVGARSGISEVSLDFNVTAVGRPPLQFTLKQEKICTSLDGRRAFSSGKREEGFSSFSFGIGGVTFSCLVLIVLIFFCVCALYQSNKKPKGKPQSPSKRRLMSNSIRDSVRRHLKRMPNPGVTIAQSKTLTKTTETSPVSMDDTNFDDQKPSTSAHNTNTRQFFSETGKSAEAEAVSKIIFDRTDNIVDINQALMELRADRNLFDFVSSYISGTFGEVVWASWRQIGPTGTGDLVDDVDDQEDDANVDTALICKTLKPGSDGVYFENFLKEAFQFHNVHAHAHLAQVTAAATFGDFKNPDSIKDFPLICYKHSGGFGFLKKFLLTCRKSVASEPESADDPTLIGMLPGISLRTHDLVDMALQVTSAINHLHSFGVIHKDVATRNCLISKLPTKLSGFYVQLTDTALSRDLFPFEYHKIELEDATSAQNFDLQPVKWMAPESIKTKVFSSSTDIWSFGVFIWELFTCGQEPYVEVEPNEMLATLIEGSRLVQPYNSPDYMYTLMLSCWNYEEKKRPTISEVENYLREFSTNLRKYI